MDNAVELSMLREFYNTWLAYHTGPVEHRESNGAMLLDWHLALQGSAVEPEVITHVGH